MANKYRGEAEIKTKSGDVYPITLRSGTIRKIEQALGKSFGKISTDINEMSVSTIGTVLRFAAGNGKPWTEEKADALMDEVGYDAVYLAINEALTEVDETKEGSANPPPAGDASS